MSPAEGSPSVLVIDDDRRFAETLAQALERRPQQRRAGEAIVNEGKSIGADGAVGVDPLTQGSDLAGDGLLAGLLVRGNASIEGNSEVLCHNNILV